MRAVTARTGGLPLLLLSGMLVSCTAFPPPAEWFRPPVEKAAPLLRRREDPAAAIQRLTWAESLRISREQSPTVAAALERIGRSEALLAEARARSYPRLDARGSYVRFMEATDFRGRTGSDVAGQGTRSRFVTGRGSDLYSGGLDLSYPLFDGGDAFYGRRAAEAALEGSRSDAGAVIQELELRVSTAFLEVLLADGAIRIARDSLRFTEDQERRARAREEAGEGLQVDTLRFATRASEERLALNRARAERRIRLAVLAELLAVPLAEEVDLVRPDAGLDLPPGDIVETALQNRPELRALGARIDEAGSKLSREKASWWPAVNLFGSYGFLSLDDLALGQREDEFQVGGALSMNLFEGGATVARQATLARELAELRRRREELALTIEREVREAEAELEVARRNVDVSGETVRLAEEVLRQITAQYRAGEAQVLDVTEATLQRTRAQLALLRSQVNFLLSQARLRRAAGVGLSGEP